MLRANFCVLLVFNKLYDGFILCCLFHSIFLYIKLNLLLIISEEAKQTEFLSLLGKNNTSKKSIQEIGTKLCLCKLKDPETNEKNALRQLFFAENGNYYREAIFRRESLTLFLSIIQQANKKLVRLNTQSFLSACYFNQIQENGNTFPIVIPTKLSDISDKWKIVKAQDHLAYTLDSILQCFLQFLKTKNGASLDEFFETHPNLLHS